MQHLFSFRGVVLLRFAYIDVHAYLSWFSPVHSLTKQNKWCTKKTESAFRGQVIAHHVLWLSG